MEHPAIRGQHPHPKEVERVQNEMLAVEAHKQAVQASFIGSALANYANRTVAEHKQHEKKKQKRREQKQARKKGHKR
jgi:hypothetical protein